MGIRCNLSTSGNMRGNMYRGVGGGSTVEITPTYNSGTKIADYSIDGEEGEIYTPTPINPFNYSTNEFIVGKWIDGKDLYQRTIVLKQNDVLNYTYSSNEFVACLPENIDFIDVVQIYSDRRSQGYVDTRNNTTECVVVANPTTRNLYMKVIHDPRNCIVTIQYTYNS